MSEHTLTASQWTAIIDAAIERRHWSFAWAAASEMAHDGWPTESTEARSLVVACVRARVGSSA